MFTYGHHLRFTHLRVPQGNLLAFTELGLANPTTQMPNLARTLYFAHGQIALTCLPVQFASLVDTC
jgi:hypothetical protein